ncbi:methyltransferase domain-containing protein [Planktothrix agardhii]|uniref:methyltransferase domain-containing protein n=1 Tax=Planktothrix agardhii TaxID=1160 RepID=UPI00265C9A3B|nr:methyltransferase domain-containing protein [Planktothrix agardhii]
MVSPGSASKRPLFPDYKSYTGFDYYPDSNTDVVGDAHKLSQYFRNQKFDAIFSISVFEHLAMPWLVAREISKIIEVGGIIYHSSHFAWPLHEKPWDFWRFSDEGLRVLFSPALGFEIIKSGLFAPLRLHLDQVNSPQELLATQPGFGGVAILAKKVREVNYDKFRWDVTLDDILEADSYYPKL